MRRARARFLAVADGVLLGIATKQRTRAPMALHDALCVGARGLAGERPHPAARAITLLERAAWEAACLSLGVALPWTLRRANLLVDGVTLVGTVGRRLRVGTALLEVSEDNPPCRVMDALHPGLRAALAPGGRAGVACRVLEPGEIGLGDAVRFEA
jgi:MOSC domain-containing protein YiiM